MTGGGTAGSSTSGGAAGGTITPSTDGGTDAIYDALYDAAQGSLTGAKWVATNGSDSNAGTQTAPYATMNKALSQITGGGIIIVKDGTYSVGLPGFVNDHSSPGRVPSGSSTRFTLIRAEHRFGARLVQTAADYYGEIVRLESAGHVWIDGFIMEKRTNGTPFAVTLGDDNRLTRSIIVQGNCERYGGAVDYGNRSVVEDVHTYGWGRYAFYGGAGGSDVPAGSSVLRRCVSMLSGGPVLEPTASFAFYGANSPNYALVRDALFANCYEIDSQSLPPRPGAPDATKWGSWYHPKSVRNVLHHGCGVINSGATYGAFRTDNLSAANGDMAEYRDSFVAGFSDAEAFSMSQGVGINDGSNVTICRVPAGLQSGGVMLTQVATITSGNPVTRVNGQGAEQRFAVGAFLSKFGEPGFTTPQPSMPLWPFPYEGFIAREFAVPVSRPSGFFPTSAARTENPFAGTALDGNPKTFTRRVFEACGTPMPAGVY